jgi:hypothetical protein
MFVRRFTKKADKNKWLIFLLGGGSCKSAVECAERWCNVMTNYGADKMSTGFLKDRGVKKSIEGNGIFSQVPSNNFAGWNQVFVYYCSSDDWEGSVSNAHLSAVAPNGQQLDYLINFRGADIVEAVIGTLQREPRGDAVAYQQNGEDVVLPDINKADMVLFTGSSAGGNGVKNNVDRVGDLLRKSNRHCKNSLDCSLAYLGVIDANYPPSYANLDLTQADFCTGPLALCNYQDFYVYRWNSVDVATWKARGDESCVKWHQQNSPGTEWMCSDPQHVVNNHLTTPLFIRMDLQDQTIGGNFVDTHVTTAAQFGQATHDQLMAVVNLDSFSEEGSARSGGPRLRTPGVFGPQCTQHYGLSVSAPFFNVTISDSGKRCAYQDVLWNWIQGTQPQQIIHPFVGVGAAPDCP